MNKMALIDIADEEEFFDSATFFTGDAHNDHDDGEVFLDASGAALPDACEGIVDDASFDIVSNGTVNSEEICEEFDFREQEIEVPDWAVSLFGLPHAGRWTVYQIAGYDSLDREGGKNTIPQGFDFRDQVIDVPEWAVGLFGLPHAGNWTVFQIAAYDPFDGAADETTQSKRSWIKRVVSKTKKGQKGIEFSFIKRFTKDCFGGCVAVEDRHVA